MTCCRWLEWGSKARRRNVNNSDAVNKVLPAWEEQLGYDPLLTSQRPGMGAEDFAYFTQTEHKVPGVFFSVGGTPPDLMREIIAGQKKRATTSFRLLSYRSEFSQVWRRSDVYAAVELLNNP